VSSETQMQAQVLEEHHPGPREYAIIALILTVITSMEVAAFYISAIGNALAYVVIVLSFTKFVIVVGYYMHLKFDAKLFRYFFIAGFCVALAIISTLMALFARW
jgi:cytochrome c oxidase subunit IV